MSKIHISKPTKLWPYFDVWKNTPNNPKGELRARLHKDLIDPDIKAREIAEELELEEAIHAQK